MRTSCALLGLLLAGGWASAETLAFTSGTTRVALIELFTSEGCSSCPEADRWLGALRGEPGLWKEFVPVEFHVNFWDSLGWKDRLSSSAYTNREYAYASAWGSLNVYTPCFVRNGMQWRPLWGSAVPMPGSSGVLKVELGDPGSCRISFLPAPGGQSHGGSLTVHVALLGGGITSRVTAGENSGETLGHEFVVVGMAAAELTPEGSTLRAAVPLPVPTITDMKRRALAAWVTRSGELEPLQATGGWLP